jgi:hypothetical protein
MAQSVQAGNMQHRTHGRQTVKWEIAVVTNYMRPSRDQALNLAAQLGMQARHLLLPCWPAINECKSNVRNFV